MLSSDKVYPSLDRHMSTRFADTGRYFRDLVGRRSRRWLVEVEGTMCRPDIGLVSGSPNRLHLACGRPRAGVGCFSTVLLGRRVLLWVASFPSTPEDSAVPAFHGKKTRNSYTPLLFDADPPPLFHSKLVSSLTLGPGTRFSNTRFNITTTPPTVLDQTRHRPSPIASNSLPMP